MSHDPARTFSRAALKTGDVRPMPEAAPGSKASRRASQLAAMDPARYSPPARTTLAADIAANSTPEAIRARREEADRATLAARWTRAIEALRACPVRNGLPDMDYSAQRLAVRRAEGATDHAISAVMEAIRAVNAARAEAIRRGFSDADVGAFTAARDALGALIAVVAS